MALAFSLSLPVLPSRFTPCASPRPQCISDSPPIRRVTLPFMHGPATSPTTTSSKKGPKSFVDEMRMIAMRLHTKDQAPREGAQEESALPISEWYPSKENFMQFLVDSRYVYNYFEEELCAEGNGHTMFGSFENTGLERLEALNTDIAYLEGLGVGVSEVGEAGLRYVDYLKGLVTEKPESVLCHWYNYYFAHSAGGRMIGRLMQDRLFEGRGFKFYEWEGDVKEILGKVRVVIDDTAGEWSRELKDECLKETGLAFGYSGTVLQYLAKADGK